jgi:hypothetical protein
MMPPIHDFVGAVAVAGKLFKEIEKTVKTVHEDKAVKKMQLYEIIRKVKEGKPAANQRVFNGKGVSVIRLSSPMLPPRSPMTGLSPSEDLLRPMACRPRLSMPLSTRLFTCQKIPPDGSPSFLTRR